jgi:hypothetical protein
VLEQLRRDEGGAVAAHEHPRLRQRALRLGGELDDLRDVRQVVQGEPHRLGPPGGEQLAIVPALEDLQVEEPHVVAGRLQGGGDALDAERLQAEVDLGEQKRARVHQENAHAAPPSPRLVPASA